MGASETTMGDLDVQDPHCKIPQARPKRKGRNSIREPTVLQSQCTPTPNGVHSPDAKQRASKCRRAGDAQEELSSLNSKGLSFEDGTPELTFLSSGARDLSIDSKSK